MVNWLDFFVAYEEGAWRESAAECCRLFEMCIALRQAHGDPPYTIDDPVFWARLYCISDDESPQPSLSPGSAQEGGFQLRSGRRSSLSPPPRKRIALSPTAGLGQDVPTAAAAIPSPTARQGQDVPTSPILEDCPSSQLPQQQQDRVEPPHRLWKLKAWKVQTAPRFKRHKVRVAVQFEDEIPKAEETIMAMFDNALQETRKLSEAQDDDWFSLYIHHHSLDTPIHIGHTRVKNLNGAQILRRIQMVQQSKRDLSVDGEMTIEVDCWGNRTGGSRVQRLPGMQRFGRKGGSTLEINNADKLCFPRAVAVAIDHAHRNDSPEAAKNYKASRTRAGPRGQQAARAKDIMREAGLEDFPGPCGRDQWNAIYESLLPRYQLRIFGHQQADSIIFPGSGKLMADYKEIIKRREPPPIPLYILLDGEHFKVITTITGFAGKSYWCDVCNQGREHKSHRCQFNYCGCCRTSDGCERDDNGGVNCDQCRRWFKNKNCYQNHLKKGPRGGKSICELIYRCVKCGDIINKSVEGRAQAKHRCNAWWCVTCREFHDRAGEKFPCYIQPIVDEDEPGVDEDKDDDDDDDRQDQASQKQPQH